MNNSIRGEEAFAVHQKIVGNEKTRRELMAESAKLLNEMHEKNYFQDILGQEGEGEWAGYLGQIEVFYSRSKVHQLTTCYKRFTQKLGIPEEVWAQVPLTRLMDALPVIDENNYVDWFSKALVLTTRDWNIELRSAKGLTTEEDKHEHDMVNYDICKKCGRKEKHHHEEEPLSVVRPAFPKKK